MVSTLVPVKSHVLLYIMSLTDTFVLIFIDLNMIYYSTDVFYILSFDVLIMVFDIIFPLINKYIDLLCSIYFLYIIVH